MTIEQKGDLTSEQVRNLEINNFPEYCKWLEANIKKAWAVTQGLKEKLRRIGALEFDNEYGKWIYKRSQLDQNQKFSYDGIFSDDKNRLSSRYDSRNESFTVYRRGQLYYTEYYDSNTLSFSPGGFGGGFVPNVLSAVDIDKFGVSKLSSTDNNPQSIKTAFDRVFEICDEITALIPVTRNK